MKTKPKSLFLLLLTAAIWGFAFVAQVEGMEFIRPHTMNGVRFALGAVALVPVMLFFERGRVGKEERKKTIIASLVAGSVLFCASALQQMGIEKTGSAGVAGFITGLYTVLIPIVCYVLFKSKTGINTWIGAICAVVGLFLLCYKPNEGLCFGYGELLLLVGSFFWTAHVIVIDRMGKGVRSLHLSCGQFAVCAVLSLICMFIFEEPTVGAIFDAKWTILYCGLLSVGVAYTLQVVAQKSCDPTLAAIVLSCESVFSAIGGAVFKIDTITLIGYVGCALMFAGIIFSQIEFKRKKNEIE